MRAAPGGRRASRPSRSCRTRARAVSASPHRVWRCHKPIAAQTRPFAWQFAPGQIVLNSAVAQHTRRAVKPGPALQSMDAEAYAAVKANDPRALQRRLREAESSFPVNVGARNGAGLTMLHVGMRLVNFSPSFSLSLGERGRNKLTRRARRRGDSRAQESLPRTAARAALSRARCAGVSSPPVRAPATSVSRSRHCCVAMQHATRAATTVRACCWRRGGQTCTRRARTAGRHHCSSQPSLATWTS